MNSNQGVWDAITKIQNTERWLRSGLHDPNGEVALLRAQIVALTSRVDELEGRFKSMKKAVWRA